MLNTIITLMLTLITLGSLSGDNPYPSDFFLWKQIENHISIYCKVTRIEPSITEFNIFSYDGKSRKSIYNKKMFDAYDRTIFLGTNSDLMMMITVGGSAYNINIYQYNDNKVVNTLHVGTKSLPEILYVGSSLYPVIIITHWVTNDKPDESIVYKYDTDSHQYKIYHRRPYANRFRGII